MAEKRRWSPQEKAVIKEHYRYIPLRDLLQALPGRSDKAVRDTASRMGLKKAPEAIRETISKGLTASHARRRAENGDAPLAG